MTQHLLFKLSHAGSTGTVGTHLEVHRPDFPPLLVLNAFVGPLVRMTEQLVLHPCVVAHPQLLTVREIEEEEVCFARLQNGALGRASPVEECLRGVEQRHLERESSQRVHLGEGAFLLS